MGQPLGKLLAAVIVVSGLAVGTAACSSSGDGGGGDGLGTASADCTRYCEKNDQCNPSASQGSCMNACANVRFSTACVDAVVAADCTEFNKSLSDNPSWAATCFPACSAAPTQCEGTWATTCSDGRQITMSCAFACEANGSTFTGTCASTYEGQPCSNGGECCWCA